MVMPPHSSSSSSSGMQSIRRELHRRRAKPLASSAAKKTSAPPTRPPRQEDPSSTTASKSPPASTGTHAARPPLPRAQPSPLSAAISPSTPPPSRSASSSAGSACRASSSAAAHLRPGTAVGVRTRTTKLKTGKVLVLWLRAMVVSPTHQGYKVVYDGNWPPREPYGTVHVSSRHVRMIEPSQSPTTPPTSLHPSRIPSPCASATAAAVPASQKEEMRAAPRPTRAGKSLRLVRSLFPEIERQARPALP